MRVLLVDFDSKIPNLALMKESTWYTVEGHEVGFKVRNPNLVIVSVIFQKNRVRASAFTNAYPNAKVIYGGPGMFPDCGNIGAAELMKPDYNLYPSEYSQGFTTRGCIRHCSFCLVPQMEGPLRTVQLPHHFHDDQFRTCMIMDNNLLAAPGPWVHEVLGWFRDAGVGMDATQGLDARLLTEEWAGMLKDIRHPRGIHFAWDNLGDEAAIIKAIGLLKGAGFNLKHDVSFYILAGFNTTFEEDLYRCDHLREMGVNSFVMRYHKRNRMLNRLAKWANRRHAYWSGPFIS
jgi:hypothetical protein